MSDWPIWISQGDANQSAGCGQSNTVLAGTGFGNHFLFAHEFGQQGFAKAMVNFMRTGVI